MKGAGSAWCSFPSSPLSPLSLLFVCEASF
jgi:hypothetical protein